jgi:DNA-binding NtrC family response regulator
MQPLPKVLIIDDDPEILRILARILSPAYSVHLACSGEEGLEQFERLHPDLVLLDLMLPQMGGMAVLRSLKRMSDDVLVIIMTAYGNIQTAVQAIQLGAVDYLEKPFDNQRLLGEVGQILAVRVSKKRPTFDKIIGNSPPIQQVWRLVERFGPTDIPILLQGETGTGKEVFAQVLHQISKRGHGPLVQIDCGTVPEQLAESELFGYEQGAFTGAANKKPGQVAWADGGTLFLDEVGVLSLASQAKLLRFVEQQGFIPLGARDAKLRRLDVRFISATNVPLRTAIEEGAFREDLYQRLTGVTIELPPLRERRGDLELLCQYFLDRYRHRHNKPEVEISEDCMGVFLSYSWPGNIRELQRVIAAAVVMADRSIRPEHLPSCIREHARAAPSPDAGFGVDSNSGLTRLIDLKEIKERAGREAQKQVILEIQRRAHVNHRELARMLRVDPKTLRCRLREMGIG